MTPGSPNCRILCLVAIGLACSTTGCQTWRGHSSPLAAAPLGTLSDPVWQTQETNAEMSDFILHEHEFRMDSDILNTGGEDHLRQIAARLLTGQDAQVVVERSMTASRADTEYRYPVHPDPARDMRRREIVVRALTSMGINDADDRVLVAPSFAQGFRGTEAEATFRNGMQQAGGGGFGGGFGGFFFGGGGGIF